LAVKIIIRVSMREKKLSAGVYGNIFREGWAVSVFANTYLQISIRNDVLSRKTEFNLLWVKPFRLCSPHTYRQFNI